MTRDSILRNKWKEFVWKYLSKGIWRMPRKGTNTFFHYGTCTISCTSLRGQAGTWICQGESNKEDDERQPANLQEEGKTEQPGATPPPKKEHTLLCHPSTMKWTFITENLRVQWLQEGFQVQGEWLKNWKVLQVTDGVSLGMGQHNSGVVSITRQWWIKREILKRITKKTFWDHHKG